MGYLSYFLFISSNNLLARFFISLICLIFAARQLRALENIVHFGSHNNVSKNKTVNDLVVNVLVAYPLFQDVKKYRHFHNQHHRWFGSENDPCKIRFAHFKKESQGFSNIWSLFVFIKDNIFWYLTDYYKEIGSNPKTLSIFLLWHLTVFLLITYFVNNIAYFYISLWMFSLFVVLPVIRFVAELSEHDYHASNTVFGSTFNNISFWDKLLFHPAGDAYHLVHHLYPSVPWCSGIVKVDTLL